jgi:hypothetical protein
MPSRLLSSSYDATLQLAANATASRNTRCSALMARGSWLRNECSCNIGARLPRCTSPMPTLTKGLPAGDAPAPGGFGVAAGGLGQRASAPNRAACGVRPLLSLWPSLCRSSDQPRRAYVTFMPSARPLILDRSREAGDGAEKGGGTRAAPVGHFGNRSAEGGAPRSEGARTPTFV